jgi:hypothetical protein
MADYRRTSEVDKEGIFLPRNGIAVRAQTTVSQIIPHDVPN